MTAMAEATYLLCAATALVCVGLLLRAFLRTRVRLLLWSGICFIALSLENALLFLDMVIVPDVNLQVWRNAVALIGLLCLLFGLIWDNRTAP
jgi:hydrogenase/urease accessory protein HupE